MGNGFWVKVGRDFRIKKIVKVEKSHDNSIFDSNNPLELTPTQLIDIENSPEEDKPMDVISYLGWTHVRQQCTDYVSIYSASIVDAVIVLEHMIGKDKGYGLTGKIQIGIMDRGVRIYSEIGSTKGSLITQLLQNKLYGPQVKKVKDILIKQQESRTIYIKELNKAIALCESIMCELDFFV